MPPESTEEWTVDQLAHDHGLPVSTLRLYQNRGLLPPPARRGRQAFYGPDHRARLELIGELQARGFSLAGIKELLDGWQEGRSLDDLLGLSAAGGPWQREAPVVIDPSDLVQRFGGEQLTPALMRRVVELGLIELTDEGRVRVVSPRFLEIGTELGALGFPVAEIIDEYEVLAALTETIADRFTEMFRRHVWQPFADAGMPAAQLDQITRSLDELGPLAQAVLDSAFRQALQHSAQRFLDEQAEALAGRTAGPAGTARGARASGATTTSKKGQKKAMKGPKKATKGAAAARAGTRK